MKLHKKLNQLQMHVKYETINKKPFKTALVNNFIGNFKASKLNTSDSGTILC